MESFVWIASYGNNVLLTHGCLDVLVDNMHVYDTRCEIFTWNDDSGEIILCMYMACIEDWF